MVGVLRSAVKALAAFITVNAAAFVLIVMGVIGPDLFGPIFFVTGVVLAVWIFFLRLKQVEDTK